jgi:hypothetical protein
MIRQRARAGRAWGEASNQVVEKLAITKKRIAEEFVRRAFYDMGCP